MRYENQNLHAYVSSIRDYPPLSYSELKLFLAAFFWCAFGDAALRVIFFHIHCYTLASSLALYSGLWLVLKIPKSVCAPLLLYPLVHSFDPIRIVIQIHLQPSDFFEPSTARHRILGHTGMHI
jgi:hypothetical protein